MNICALQYAVHNHLADNETISKDTVTNNIRRLIKDNPTKPIKRAYDEAIISTAETDTPEFKTIRSQLNRKRAQILPPIPHVIEDINLEGEWEQAWNGEPFLSHQDNAWGIIIFATRRNYIKLKQCDNIYIDGTFKTCPKPFKQFVTIHGNYMGRVLPFVMCLVTGKQVGQYRQIFQHLKQKVLQHSGEDWDPGRVISDFELSIILAVEAELPNTEISPCYFHFTQNLWRRMQKLGLSGHYNSDKRLKKCLRKFMAIGYLPLALVRHNFNALAQSRETRRLVRRYPSLQRFIRYMEVNYMDPNGNYPPRMWNKFGHGSDTRTNNFVEGQFLY